jgi:hypothetical protein
MGRYWRKALKHINSADLWCAILRESVSDFDFAQRVTCAKPRSFILALAMLLSLAAGEAALMTTTSHQQR